MPCLPLLACLLNILSIHDCQKSSEIKGDCKKPQTSEGHPDWGGLRLCRQKVMKKGAATQTAHKWWPKCDKLFQFSMLQAALPET